jgi:hypothetical protein
VLVAVGEEAELGRVVLRAEPRPEPDVVRDEGVSPRGGAASDAASRKGVTRGNAGGGNAGAGIVDVASTL